MIKWDSLEGLLSDEDWAIVEPYIGVFPYWRRFDKEEPEEGRLVILTNRKWANPEFAVGTYWGMGLFVVPSERYHFPRDGFTLWLYAGEHRELPRHQT